MMPYACMQGLILVRIVGTLERGLLLLMRHAVNYLLPSGLDSKGSDYMTHRECPEVQEEHVTMSNQ